jgi:hypothetical protein
MPEGERKVEIENISREKSAGLAIAEKTVQHLEEVVGLRYDQENLQERLVILINERLVGRGLDPLSKEGEQAVGNALMQAHEGESKIDHKSTIDREKLRDSLSAVIAEHLKPKEEQIGIAA